MIDLSSLLLCRASSMISNHKVVFHTLDSEVEVEVPESLIRLIIRLCDGTLTYEKIIEEVKTEWDKGQVRALINDLFQKGVLVDACNFTNEIWKAIENPMRFPTNISERDVSKLVEKGRKRHQANLGDEGYTRKLSSFTKKLMKRRSVRRFSGEVVSLGSVVSMLWSAYGEFQSQEDGNFHRTVPSAGALYPLIIHIALFSNADDLEIGIYRVLYNKKGQVGFEFVSKDVCRFARAFLNPTGILDGIRGVIVISGSFTITGEKYGNRGLLYVSLEAGHAAQNIFLEAIENEVATLEIGGFVDELLAESITLPSQYKPLTTIAFGKEKEDIEEDNQTKPEVKWIIPKVGDYKPPFVIASAKVLKERSWSNGRDADPKMAYAKAVSEAREWAACGCIPDLIKSRFLDIESVIDPRRVICFYPAQYRVRGFPFARFNEDIEYEWAEAYEYTSGLKKYVLADHVYFPYFPGRPYYAFANSSGCAAYPKEKTAVEKAVLELIERDAFMNAYLCQLDLPVVAQKTIPTEIQKRIIDLQRIGFKVWIKDHSLDLAPVMFVFVQNEELKFTACASCSSFDLEYGLSRALTEVEAAILARLQNGAPTKIKPSEVGFPLDHGRLYGQERYFREADFLALSRKKISFREIGCKVSYNWGDLVNKLSQKELEIIIVPLNLSKEYGGNGDLHIVRAIIPGLVPMTFGFRQEPAGMRRIYEIAERFKGKKLSYNDLMKFPHPFE